MNDEKFGVTLELITAPFTKKMNALKSTVNNFISTVSKGVEPKFEVEKALNDLDSINEKYKDLTDKQKKELSIKLKYSDVKDMEAELKKINVLASSIPEIIEQTKNYPNTTEFAKNLENETKSLSKYSEKIKEFKNELNNLENSQAPKKLNNELSSSFEKGISKIKKFTLSLISVRSIFSLVSRASSQYLSQDTENANKLQSAWIGLGSIMAPLIEKIANFTIRAVSYINVFIRALTGVDLLAKATTKSMDNLSKSAKNATKTLAGIDEITNLNSDTSSSNSFNWADNFKNIELNTKIVKFIENVADKLKGLYNNVLKPIGSWIIEHKELIILLIEAVLAYKLVKKFEVLKGSVDKLLISLGSKGGAGLIGSLYALATIGSIVITIKIIKDIKEENKNLKEQITSLREQGNETFKEWAENATDLGEIFYEMQGTQENITKALILSSSLTSQIFGHSEEYLKNAKQFVINSGYIVDNLHKQYEEEKLNNEEKAAILSKLKEQIAANDLVIEKLKSQGENTSSLVEIQDKYKDLTLTIVDNLIEQGKSYDEITEKTGLSRAELNNYKEDLKKFCEVKPELKVNVTADTSSASSKITNFFNKIKNAFAKLTPRNISVDNFSKQVASYDVGTNYVPNDQLAYIHKGEAVIPKKFNSSAYFNSDNEETCRLLETLIEKVDNIDLNPQISVREVGKASVNYINSEKRKTGRSVV